MEGSIRWDLQRDVTAFIVNSPIHFFQQIFIEHFPVPNSVLGSVLQQRTRQTVPGLLTGHYSTVGWCCGRGGRSTHHFQKEKVQVLRLLTMGERSNSLRIDKV